MIVDTSFVLALMREHEADHERVREWHAGYRGALVTSPLAVAEMDHLLRASIGLRGARLLEDELDAGTLRVDWSRGDLYEAIAVSRTRDDVGLVDASLVVLAMRLQTTEIATLDERHFRTLRPLTGEPAFRLLPADTDRS